MLDTDTASYVIKGRDSGLEARLAAIEPSTICISVVTRAELLYGLKRLPASHPLHAHFDKPPNLKSVIIGVTIWVT